ncbi:cysteine-rich receptor-like protein kinase 40 isoform X3 [Lolium perenne]|uniref:cysteine-rich receptor-like protein kinase 40 isoform X3 n=1 Tax=Lolium perenne TaxID=4522 RepID=UPI0021F64929|nr:putative cysteine-rich receptor-like protein kinase 30 isoform X6 [Lolium perenne]
MNTAPVTPKPVTLHLLEELTNNFSPDRKLGGGTYGDVYLGEHKNGEKIAVKVLKEGLDLNDEEFQKEYHNLANLHHKNVVRLVGYCHETKREFVPYKDGMILSYKIKRMLCFDYMHKGSLGCFIYDEFNDRNWCTRYAIIKGICEGLEYLHEKLKPPMYHLDLKPANVLLDENMSAKIADFGVSRLFLEEKTRKTNSALGTLGYIPPEYINEGLISIKFDIFSLGVVIIKIMTGREGYFRIAEMSSQQFIELVHMDWMNRLQPISVHVYSVQVRRCIEIALSCVEADRHKRPSIGLIVSALNKTESCVQILDALRNDSASSINQLCPCITTDHKMLHLLKEKLISYQLCITDNRSKGRLVTITTSCDPEVGTSKSEPVRPRIKIIRDYEEGLSVTISMDAHSTKPWILLGHVGGEVSIWNHQNQMWNMDTPTPVASFECDQGSTSGLDYFCPGGALQYLVTDSEYLGIAQIWDLQSNTCIKLINGLQKMGCNIAVVERPSGRPILLTVSDDHTIAFCDSTTHRYDNRVNFNMGRVEGFAYIKMTKSLAILCYKGIAIMEID